MDGHDKLIEAFRNFANFFFMSEVILEFEGSLVEVVTFNVQNCILFPPLIRCISDTDRC